MEHLFCVLQRCFSQFRAAEHAGDFFQAICVTKDTNRGAGAALNFALLYDEMLVGEGGDLREVRDAKDLLRAGKRLEFVTDGFGCAASNADVDFVEDERSWKGCALLPTARFRCTFFNADFECKQNAGHFAAGCDFVERLHRLAGIGGDVAFDLVPPMGCPAAFCFVGANGDRKLHLHGEVVDLLFDDFLEAVGGGLA